MMGKRLYGLLTMAETNENSLLKSIIHKICSKATAGFRHNPSYGYFLLTMAKNPYHDLDVQIYKK